MIDGYKQFNKFGGYTPTIAVSEFPAPIERALCKTDTGTLAWHEPENRFLHSQECITAYYDAAAFIYFNVKQIYEDKQAVLEEYVPYILPKWKVTDINTYDDLMVAKYLQLGRSLEN